MSTLIRFCIVSLSCWHILVAFLHCKPSCSTVGAVTVFVFDVPIFRSFLDCICVYVSAFTCLHVNFGIQTYVHSCSYIYKYFVLIFCHLLCLQCFVCPCLHVCVFVHEYSMLAYIYVHICICYFNHCKHSYFYIFH